MQRLVDAGELTEEEAEQSERRNIILQALGPDPRVKVDLTHQPLRRGDTLIICSDGLSGRCGARRSPSMVAAHPDLPDAVRRADRSRQRARRARQHHGGRGPVRGRRAARAPERRRRGLPGLSRLPDGGDPEPTTTVPLPSRPRHPPRAPWRLCRPPAGTRPGRRALLLALIVLLLTVLLANRLCRRPGDAAPLGARLTWVGGLSFASGLPYFLFNETHPGLAGAAGRRAWPGSGSRPVPRCPWVLKFLWAPARRPARQPAAVDQRLPRAARGAHRAARARRPRAPRRAARRAAAALS